MSSIDSSRGDYYDVYTGFWINWSYGRVRGATITLTQSNGSLLIAFLALFVAAAGKSFWRLVCYALHQACSDPSAPQDGFYHQRQAILRNSETAFQGGWDIFYSMTVWKRSRSGQRLFRRSLPIVATAIVLSVGFTLAGIFSSSVSSGDTNEVVLSGRKCGLADTNIDYLMFEHEYSPWRSHRNQEFLFYARSCYHNISNTQGCNLYVKPRLRLQADRNASCPFTEHICRTKYGNLHLDTGFINTHVDLGINAVREDRLEFRHIYHCAPIKSQGYSSIVRNVSDARNRTKNSLFRLFYGEFDGYSRVRPTYQNYTYQVPINISYVNSDNTSSELTAPTPDYRVGSVASYGNVGDSFFDMAYKPIPPLQVPDSDVILFFLSAPDINFQQKVDDLWFSAHTKGKRMTGASHGQDRGWTYVQDEPATTLACTRQVQYCKATRQSVNQRCEPLRGQLAPAYKKTTLGDKHSDELIEAVEELIMRNLMPTEQLSDFIGSSILVARSGLVASTQGDLPSNQWQIEIENLVSTNLAAFQGSSVDSVSGPPTPGIEKVWSRPNGTMTKKLCKSQKILSTRYSSFSVLGLSLILAIGSVTIILHYSLEPTGRPLCGYRLRKTSQDKVSQDEEVATSVTTPSGTASRLQHQIDARALRFSEWDANATLQLQRLAHEAVGAGSWHRTSSGVPVTLPDQSLGTLGFKRPPRGHPYLVGPSIPEQSSIEVQTDSKSENSSSASRTNDMDKISAGSNMEGNTVHEENTDGSGFHAEDLNIESIREDRTNIGAGNSAQQALDTRVGNS